MAAERYAIVVTREVVNVVLWDAEDQPDWRPGEGEAVPCPDHVGPGWTYARKQWSAPKPDTADAL